MRDPLVRQVVHMLWWCFCLARLRGHHAASVIYARAITLALEPS